MLNHLGLSIAFNRGLQLGLVFLFILCFGLLLGRHLFAFFHAPLAAAGEPPTPGNLITPSAPTFNDGLIWMLVDVDEGNSEYVAFLDIFICDDGYLSGARAERGPSGRYA